MRFVRQFRRSHIVAVGLLVAVVAAVVRRLPPALRQFPFNALLWDLRRRIRTGRPLV